MRQHTAVLAAALCLGAHAIPAQAQLWQQQVTTRLERASSTAASGGMRSVLSPMTGSLRTGTNATHTVQLNAGTQYMLVGVCDDDCTDIDLVLLDPSGAQIGADLDRDAIPVVQVTPSRSGTYSVRASMPSCSSQPCFYGVGVYAATTRPTVTLTDRLERASQDMVRGGMQTASTPLRGSLLQDGATSHSVRLNAGTLYRMVGVCDGDCPDLDLVLLDPSGSQVASDLASDDTPEIAITPSRSGLYSVRAVMATCTRQPCGYMVGVYQGSGDIRPQPRPEPSISWAEQARTLLRRLEDGFGLGLAQEPWTGSLRARATRDLTVYLYAGTQYTIAGLCDQDCGDFDLTLLDERGRQVTSDVATDATPVLQVKPSRNGNYTVRATMAACRAEPCGFGVGVYR
jgi:hypothetical protein